MMGNMMGYGLDPFHTLSPLGQSGAILTSERHVHKRKTEWMAQGYDKNTHSLEEATD